MAKNLWLLDPTDADAATVTGLGTLASAMPAHHVLSQAPGSRARWTATASAGIKLDLGSDASWDTIALLGHTAGASDTWRIRADADEADVAGDSATVDVSGRSFWPSSGKRSGRDVWHSFYRDSTVRTLRWLRLDFTIASAPFDIRRIMIGKAFQPTHNFGYGMGDGYIPTGAKSRSVGGHAYGLYGRPLNVKTLTLVALTQAELDDSLRVLIRNRSAERDLLLCLNEEADADLADKLLWGTIEDPGIGRLFMLGRYQYPLSFIEQAP